MAELLDERELDDELLPLELDELLLELLEELEELDEELELLLELELELLRLRLGGSFGPTSDPPGAHPANTPTPARATLPESTFKNCRRSSRASYSVLTS